MVLRRRLHTNSSNTLTSMRSALTDPLLLGTVLDGPS
jgi:hypothetical protein